MRLSTSQYVVRLTWGLGLLLASAVQQKVCTRPTATDAAFPEPARPAPLAAPDEQSDSKSKRQPLTLAAMVPDVLAPRWPIHTHLTAAQRERPLWTTTWISGPRGAEEDSAASADSHQGFAVAWSRIPVSQVAPTFGHAGVRRVRVHRHSFLTSILKTGPPTA